MKTIRAYDGTNFQEVSGLLATMMKEHTFKNVNDKSKEKFLGIFNYVDSKDPKMIMELERTLAMSDIWIAYDCDEIVGVVRGSKDNILNLFVLEEHTRNGIGRELVKLFEDKCKMEGFPYVRLSSTVEAVGFYESLGYKKTTGLRMARYSGKRGYEYQPMMKPLF
ncbi:GNAT family N-acetyltransferase [Acidaminobacter sp. JC074]|uniref:GNAT family N-acetyltransferase n=1 Tax=Acidaminobacter sp. JC074 TaxID=2530199 RepID=UPI001F0D77B1|nr:GNAT family N-acetyltransferase [Acidaminobacter sp. JC074]MCH4888319.1 GNAT family N-acetyltransferase [Acidaminobacter sp. JC074]